MPTCGTYAIYWSTTYNGVGNAFHVGFKGSSFYYCDFSSISSFFSWTSSYTALSSYGRFGGYSVRLVCDVGPAVYNIGVSVNPTEGGMVSGGGAYDEGTTCTLTATPNPGYSFVNWTENGMVVTTNTSYIFMVTGDRNLVANFSINSYNISASTNPTNGGTITGTGIYNYGETVILAATANEGYTFTNWTENGSVVSTSADYIFAVTGNRNLVANFNLNSYFIAASANPSNGGTVTGSGTYNHGTTATLTATPNNNYVFSSWTENGVVVCTDASYSFMVTGIRSLVANFTSTIVNYTVTATANPTAGGSISGMGSYEEGSTCALTAMANTGYSFTNWSENGYVVSTNPSFSFTVTGNRSFVANFTLNSYCIATLVNPIAGGSVIGAGNYNYGTTATLTAIANNGYSFLNWTENGSVVSASANYSFTVTGTRNLVANFSLNTYTVSVAVNPVASGTVSGMGTYNYGETATLTATANEGYTFANWTEDGAVVSTNVNYSFEVMGDRSLVANFNPKTYTVSASANPAYGGSVVGGSSYAYGAICTLIATANEEYSFANWTENGMVVSTDSMYSFTVIGNRTLVANFIYVGIEGMLNGIFSVGNNTKVCFSQGNLQYQASTDTWRFADNQWDYVGGMVMSEHHGNVSGSSNSNISPAYDGWIDLFGWGTSGWNNGNTCYHPWDINSDNDGTLFGPPGLNSLIGDNANADWGVYNPISNGGNQANQWRTLTYWEWNCLLNTRTTSSGVRYAKAQLNGVNGLILVPDNWDTSVYELQNVNTSESSYDSNVIGLTVWINTFESNGAVFLPAAGARIYGTTMFYLNDRGYYWSSTCHGNLDNYAIDWGFSDEWLNYFAGNRSTGMSVRLVRDVVTQTVALSEGWNWISLYVELGDPVEALRMFEAALGDNATVISASEMYTEYYGNDIWIGDLDEVGIANEQMYMVEVVNDCEVTLEGTIANPADHAITINPGWNWIGFPYGQELNLEDALADFEAEEGDQLTEAELYTEYGFGMWIGDVAMLVPGQGYMYYSNSTQPKTLVFPSTSKGKNVFLRKRK